MSSVDESGSSNFFPRAVPVSSPKDAKHQFLERVTWRVLKLSSGQEIVVIHPGLFKLRLSEGNLISLCGDFRTLVPNPCVDCRESCPVSFSSSLNPDAFFFESFAELSSSLL